MADGHVNKCKECNKKDVRENRSDKTEYYKEYDKNRDQTPERKALKETYAKGKGKDKADAAKKRWREKNPKKRSVHVAVGNALRDGDLVKQPCQVCGDTTVHAHHCDYNKPFDILWLCPLHHEAWHQEHGEGLNSE